MSMMTTAAKSPGGLDISLEFFPAKTPKGAEKLPGVAAELVRELTPVLGGEGPSFFSVTYGAGGTTQEGTLDAVTAIRAASGLPGAAHLTVVGQSKAKVDSVAREYLAAGVERIVALRGDAQTEDGIYRPHPEGYSNAADLIGGLKAIHDFDISVAAYPEIHPDSKDRDADLDNLKAKFDAGADRAITQFFFDADTFLRYRDMVTARGIWQPIVPGILPIRDLDQVCRFADGCGATIPGGIGPRFEAAGEDREARRRVSVDLAVELCERLMRHGVDAFHFYTLNQADMTLAVVPRLASLATGQAASAGAA